MFSVLNLFNLLQNGNFWLRASFSYIFKRTKWLSRWRWRHRRNFKSQKFTSNLCLLGILRGLCKTVGIFFVEIFSLTMSDQDEVNFTIKSVWTWFHVVSEVIDVLSWLFWWENLFEQFKRKSRSFGMVWSFFFFKLRWEMVV